LVVAIDKRRNELTEAITSLVASATWDEVGGPGHIKWVEGARSMAISQTFECHREIEDFLAALRAARREQAAGKAQAAANAADDEAMSLRIYNLPGHWLSTTGATPSAAAASQPPAAPKQEPPKVGAEAKTPPTVHSQMGGGSGVNHEGYPSVEQLAKAIPASIAPESWTQADGQGTISVVGHALAIRQTNRIHHEIRRFLEALN
jgi:hypothetical protein